MTLADDVNISMRKVWHISGDSRVAIAAPFIHHQRFSLTYLNRKLPIEYVTADTLNQDWLALPRMDMKWVNPGSAWVHKDEQKNWDRRTPPATVRNIVQSINSNGIVQLKKPGPGTGFLTSITCYDLMLHYVRLWGIEKFPTEPNPFRTTVAAKVRPKKVVKSALERVLDDELDLEEP